MAEVLVRFTEAVRGTDGKLYQAQVCGDVADDGMWEGWVEFVDNDGRAIRTARETGQPNRADLVYWAEGLSDAYLEGALTRANRAEEPRPIRRRPSLEPHFERPARERLVPLQTTTDARAILNPFTVYDAGEGILRRQLLALSRDQVRNVALAYGLIDVHADVLDTGSQSELTEQIIGAVGHRTRPERGGASEPKLTA